MLLCLFPVMGVGFSGEDDSALNEEFFACLYDNDFVCAENLINMARHKDPHNPVVWNLTGVLRFSEGDNVEAIDAFRQAILLDPGMSAARMFLGLAYKKAGLEQWQWVAENDPKALEKYGQVFGIPRDWRKWQESSGGPFEKGPRGS